MKVLCIDATPRFNPPLLVEGEVYTVIGETTDHLNQAGYLLLEVKNERWPYRGFLKSRFIPLSDIDETELVNERELVNS